MKRIINLKEAIELSSKFRKKNKTIVLAGGVFDILHLGHIRFLEHAKREGDFLFILLESDKGVWRRKGEGRPTNSQKERAEILSSLKMVDYVTLLPENFEDNDYDHLVEKIKPDVLATTEGDKNIHHKIRQAKKVRARISFAKSVENKSTSSIIRDLPAHSGR